MTEKAWLPKVSVCVVTYNQEKYIRQCLQSIVSQSTVFGFEVIVGDDCSTDSTRQIIQEFAARYPMIVRPLYHVKNVGPYNNYAAVHRMAVGEFIAHVDGDDYWLPWKLYEQVDFLSRHPECVAVYGNAMVVDDEEQLIGVFNNRVLEVFDISFLLSRGNFLNMSSMLYRSRYRKVIFGDADHDKFIDYLIHLRLGCHGKLGYLNKAVVTYRNQSSTSMLASMPDYCSLNYWYALLEAERMPVESKALVNSMSIYFFRQVFQRLRCFDIRQAVFFAGKLYREAGKNFRNQMLLLGIIRVTMHLISALPRKFYKTADSSSQLKVLHPR